MLTLFKHQWKEGVRSTVFQKNLVVNIIMGFFVLYFLVIFIALGFGMKHILAEFYPDSNPIEVFNGFLILGFLYDLVMRFFFQDLPTMTIAPYLHLPIKRSDLVNNMLVRSGFSFFNFLPLFLFVPYSLITLTPKYGIITAIYFIVLMFVIMLVNNFLGVYIKRILASNMTLMAIFAGFLVLLGALEYFDIINLTAVSTSFFGFAITNFWVLPIFLLGLVGLYFINYNYLLNHAYIEEIFTRKEEKADGFTHISWLDQFGEIGKLITLELKLIVRHKRTKMALKMTPLFLLYGLIFYPQEMYLNSNYWLIFVGVFVTGGFFLNYGQYLYSWESEHFDFVISNNIDTKNYIKSKFFLMIPIVGICYLLTIPYAYFGFKVLVVNTIMFVWNIGIGTFVLMFFSTNNSKRLELSSNDAFNMKGVGAQQFIMVIPLMVLPMLIYFPFGYFDKPDWGLGLLGLLGLVNLFFYEFWIDQIVKRFNYKKYEMASGFRKKEG